MRPLLSGLPAPVDGWLIIGETATLTLAADPGWPSAPALHAGDRSWLATVDDGVATWALTAADVTALTDAMPSPSRGIPLWITVAGTSVAAGQMRAVHQGTPGDAHLTPARILVGPAGVGVTSLTVEDGRLLVTLTDGTTVDAGEIPAADDEAIGDAVAAWLAEHGTTVTVADVDGLSEVLAGLVGTDDPRLSDARTPLAHGHEIADVEGLGAALTALSEGVASRVASDDPRLSDARTPLAHEHPIAEVTGLAGALAERVTDDDPRLSDARTPLAHSHDVSDVTGLTAALAAKADVSALAPVATSGAWADLTGRPTIPTTPEDVGAAAAEHTHAMGDVEGLSDALAAVRRYASVTTLTAGHAVTADDLGCLLLVDASAAVDVALPASGIPTGAWVDVAQVGDGSITLTGTVTATPSAVTRAQGSTVTCIHVGSGAWLVAGDLAS